MSEIDLTGDARPTVLLVDDEADALSALQRRLERHTDAFQYCAAHSAEDALARIDGRRINAAVVDLSLDPRRGPESGLALLLELQRIDPTLRVLVLTGHGSVELGVQAMNHGAASFMEKPADIPHLAALIKDAVGNTALRRWSRPSGDAAQFEWLRTKNHAMAKVHEAAAFAATTSQPVLLLGETGTGKGVLAHAIHAADMRRNGPFIRFQPSYSTHDLVASELFGHTKGAFTGATEERRGLIESADGGTLFIDEVDELPGETQVMLLHVLQEKSFRKIGARREHRSEFRLLAATNRPLHELQNGSKLRRDFYHRIAHFIVELPPLRERREDLADLAGGFIRALVNKENLRVQALSDEAIGALQQHAWPGNVRELQAVVEGGVYRAHFFGRRLVEPQDLLLNRESARTAPGGSLRERVHALELQLVRDALKRFDNNQSHAAQSLGIDRGTLRRILNRGSA